MPSCSVLKLDSRDCSWQMSEVHYLWRKRPLPSGSFTVVKFTSSWQERLRKQTARCTGGNAVWTGPACTFSIAGAVANGRKYPARIAARDDRVRLHCAFSNTEKFRAMAGWVYRIIAERYP